MRCRKWNATHCRSPKKIDACDKSLDYDNEVLFEATHVVCRVLGYARGLNEHIFMSNYEGDVDKIMAYGQVFHEAAGLESPDGCLQRLADGRRLQRLTMPQIWKAQDTGLALSAPLCTLCSGMEERKMYFEPEMLPRYWEWMVYPHHKSLVALQASAAECALCDMLLHGLREDDSRRSSEDFDDHLAAIEDLESGARQPSEGPLPESCYYPVHLGHLERPQAAKVRGYMTSLRNNGQIYLYFTRNGDRGNHGGILYINVSGRPSADIFPGRDLCANIRFCFRKEVSDKGG